MAESRQKEAQRGDNAQENEREPDKEAGVAGGTKSPEQSSQSSMIAPTAAPALAKAPEAIKRSLPLAISIMIGLLLAGAGAWLFYNLTWFILLFYLSFVLATIVEAPVAYLKRKGISRPIATVAVLLPALAIFGGVVYLLIASINNQMLATDGDLKRVPERVTSFVDAIKNRFPGFGEYLGKFDFGDAIKNVMPSMDTLWRSTQATFNAITYLIVCFFMVMYMVIEGPEHLKMLRRIFVPRVRPEATRFFDELASTHRKWFIASVGNVGSAAILTSIGLWIVGIPGAIVLGLIAGLGELIPNVGPVLFALPAIVMTLLLRPELTVVVIVMFLIVQTIQSYTISPFVMKAGVRLPVLATIVAVLVMGILFGFLGVVVAIPLTADLLVAWNYINARLEADPEDNDTTNKKPDPARMPPKASRRSREVKVGTGRTGRVGGASGAM